MYTVVNHDMLIYYEDSRYILIVILNVLSYTKRHTIVTHRIGISL